MENDEQYHLQHSSGRGIFQAGDTARYGAQEGGCRYFAMHGAARMPVLGSELSSVHKRTTRVEIGRMRTKPGRSWEVVEGSFQSNCNGHGVLATTNPGRGMRIQVAHSCNL